jgi:hypothetical protein
MDPREVLGVGPNPSPQELREAYLRKVKEHPPDQSPEEFEKIRDAFNTLNDPRHRIRSLMNSVDPLAPFASLTTGMKGQRRHVGPKPWLEVLKSK